MTTILGLTVGEFFAFYGAGLSTVLALLKLAHPRPVVRLEIVKPVGLDPELQFTINNPAKYPIMLTNIQTCGEPISIQTGSIKGWTAKDSARQALSNRLDIMIPSDNTLTISAMFVEAELTNSIWILFQFRSHRFIAWPMLPSIFYRGKETLTAMAHHARTVHLSDS